MKPSVVLLGFVLGSSAAISFSLFGVAIVFWVLQPEYPRLDSELEPLLTHLGIFVLLTGVAGLSFYGMLRERKWRRIAVTALGAMLAGVVAYYWPS